MPDEAYYAVINDNPIRNVRTLVITDPGDDLDIYCEDQREEALDQRDTIREQYDNPDINVYRVTIHEGSIERDET